MKIQRGLLTEDEFRKYLREARYPRDNGFTYERIAEETGLCDEVVRLAMTGARRPSSAMLEAVGFERVTFYRMKN